jgi:hypothetical protein
MELFTIYPEVKREKVLIQDENEEKISWKVLVKPSGQLIEYSTSLNLLFIFEVLALQVYPMFNLIYLLIPFHLP